MSQCCEDGLVCPCPPIGLIDVVGKKWAVCVVSLLGKYGTVRFGPIQRCLSGVSPATLTTTLRSLERAHLIRRSPVVGPRGAVQAYALTRSGQVLYERLLPLANWLARSPDARERPAVISFSRAEMSSDPRRPARDRTGQRRPSTGGRPRRS